MKCLKPYLLGLTCALAITAFSPIALAEEATKEGSNLNQLKATLDSSKKTTPESTEGKNDSMADAFNQECKAKFVEGFKEGLAKGGTDDLSNSQEMKMMMEATSKKVCDCASPKMIDLIAQSMKKPKDEQDAFFDAESNKILDGCMK